MCYHSFLILILCQTVLLKYRENEPTTPLTLNCLSVTPCYNSVLLLFK